MANKDPAYVAMDFHERRQKYTLQQTLMRRVWNTPCFDCSLLCVLRINLTIYGGDAKDAFAHSPGPSMPTFMKLDNAFCDWYLERTGVLLDKDLVLPVLRALQGHREAARLWEEHISAILKDVGFKNTRHEKNIYTGQFCGEKALLVGLACQVNDFAFGCRQESMAKSVYSNIGAKLTLHNEVEAPFEYLGLVDSFDGYNVLQTCDYIKLSAESYIRRLLKAHGWDNPSPRESSNKPKPPLHESNIANLFNLAADCLRILPNIKLSKMSKVLDKGASLVRFSLPVHSVVLT